MSEFILDTESFWHSRTWLRYVHDDAKYRRLNPFGLLLAVLARLSALTPPNVEVQVSPSNRPMSLNLNVVLVGRAGAGKGETINESHHLLPTPPGNRMKPIKLRTGEGVVEAFVSRTERRDADGKIVKGELETVINTDRGLIRLTEVTDLRTAFSGEGSTAMATLLAAFSGETLGGNTRSARSNVTLPRHTYRLAALIAAQPAAADVFFTNSEVGLLSRFLFANVGDPDAPDEQPPAPHDVMPDLAARIPEGPTDAQLRTLMQHDGIPQEGKEGILDWPAHIITLPEVAAREADRIRLAGTRGLLGDEDAHRIEPLARLTALFALADGRKQANEEDWTLANTIVAMSDATRAECAAAMKESQRTRKIQRTLEDQDAKEAADEQRHAKHLASAKKSIVGRLERSDPGYGGMPVGKIQNCTRHHDVFHEALADLIYEGRVERLGDGSLYALAPLSSASSVEPPTAA